MKQQLNDAYISLTLLTYRCLPTHLYALVFHNQTEVVDNITAKIQANKAKYLFVPVRKPGMGKNLSDSSFPMT